MCKGELENRKKKRDHLRAWLECFEIAQNAVPEVQKQYEVTLWEIDVLSDAPDEADEIPKPNLSEVYDADLSFTYSSLPLMPALGISSLSSTAAMSTAGSAVTYQFVSRISDIGTSDANAFSKKYTEKYQVIQNEYDLPEKIRNFLKTHSNENILERFDRAQKSYMNYKAGVGERTSAAMEMRTFLDGFYGVLLQCARKYPKENAPSWEEMAKRLSKKDERGSIYQELINQKKQKSSLKNRLSKIGKDREGTSITDLDHIWTELLDHVFTILNLIQL